MAGYGRFEARIRVPPCLHCIVKVLFDHGTPAPLRRHLEQHSVDRCAEKGWNLLENGELIRRAEEEGYEVIVTTDQKMRFQQNVTQAKLAFVVLMSPAWWRVLQRVEQIQEVIERAEPGQAIEVPIVESNT